MRKRRWAVIQFPGSNCDNDMMKVFSALEDIEPVWHWHEDPVEKKAYEVIVLPGGFSYGDYLRAGALAKISAAVSSLGEAVEAGAHLLGICNGFQILLESRLLPGYLQVNTSLRLISKTSDLEITGEAFPWFKKSDQGKRVRYPIAHKFGNYQPSDKSEGEAQTILKYIENPNGSFADTAGVYRSLGAGSIFGLMPHPERASFEALRLTDGLQMFKNARESLQ